MLLILKLNLCCDVMSTKPGEQRDGSPCKSMSNWNSFPTSDVEHDAFGAAVQPEEADAPQEEVDGEEAEGYGGGQQRGGRLREAQKEAGTLYVQVTYNLVP